MSINRNQQMCRILLRQGALVNKSYNEGKTALYKAAFCGYIEICTLLLESKASVFQKTKEGATALLGAAQNNHVDVCTLLL